MNHMVKHLASAPSTVARPTMVSILVNSLDGSCGRYELCTADTVAKIRQQLKETLPPFTEVRLFHGEQELTEGSPFELTVQAVKMPSPSKAIDAMEDFVEALDVDRDGNVVLSTKGERRPMYTKEEVAAKWRNFEQAVTLLCSRGNLERQHAIRLPVLASKPDLDECRPIAWFLGIVFGRCCEDVEEGATLVQQGQHPDAFVLGAMSELAMRSQHLNNIDGITGLAVDSLRYFHDFSQVYGTGKLFGLMWSCVRLLGCFGKEEHRGILKSVLDCPFVREIASRDGARTGPALDLDAGDAVWGSCAWMFSPTSSREELSMSHPIAWACRLLQETSSAVDLIDERAAKSHLALAGGRSIDEHDAQGTREGGSVAQPAQASHSGGEAPEGEASLADAADLEAQDRRMAQAVRESGVLADRQEGESVHKALLLSKMDMHAASKMDMHAATSSGTAHEVVLFRLTTYSNEVHDALLSSPELSACRDSVLATGCELEPSWGNGLKAFVPLGSCPFPEDEVADLRRHHVILRRSDTPRLQAALRSMSYKTRAKYREVGPVDASEVDVASDATRDDASELTADGLEFVSVLGQMVVNTFVHYPEPKAVSEASEFAQSAPCASTKEPTNPRRWAGKRR